MNVEVPVHRAYIYYVSVLMISKDQTNTPGK